VFVEAVVGGVLADVLGDFQAAKMGAHMLQKCADLAASRGRAASSSDGQSAG